jgi:hypothetical protein
VRTVARARFSNSCTCLLVPSIIPAPGIAPCTRAGERARERVQTRCRFPAARMHMSMLLAERGVARQFSLARRRRLHQQPVPNLGGLRASFCSRAIISYHSRVVTHHRTLDAWLSRCVRECRVPERQACEAVHAETHARWLAGLTAAHRATVLARGGVRRGAAPAARCPGSSLQQRTDGAPGRRCAPRPALCQRT